MADPNEAFPYLECPDFRIDELDAVVLSHAHSDHSALIPYLFKYGYRGPVYCTEPTRDLAALLMLDHVKITKSDGKKGLFDVEDVKEFVKHSVIIDWKEVSDITPDVRLTFYNSGHMLGSCSVHLNIGNGLHNFVYTADIKYKDTLLLPGADNNFPRCESMLIESTYGGKDSETEDIMEQNDHFGGMVKETFKRGGKLLLPTLGSGRAQEVIVFIVKLIELGEIDPVPIYVDGMCWDITAIYTAYPEFLNSRVRKEIFHKDNNPFLHKCVKRVKGGKERQRVIESSEPCIIVATSGMLIGGPSVEYFKAMAEDPRNTLVFSCYQGGGSMGSKVRRGEKEIVLGHEKSGRPQTIQVKMEVSKIEISGHADRGELMEYIKKCSPRPRKVMVNHGDQGNCLDLASSIHKTFRVETSAPKNLECIRLR